MTVDSYLHQGRTWFRQLSADGRVRRLGRVMAWGGTGFILSAASIAHSAQPLAMGCVSAVTGWRSAVMALGAALGYRVFWGTAGSQGIIWSLSAGVTALIFGKTKLCRETPLLIPALCALLTALTGLTFQLAGFDTPTGIYLLRVAVAAGASRLFLALVRDRDRFALWAAEGIAVLALSQIAPLPWLNPGLIAAGMLGAAGQFPGALLSGLALDLARISPVPMTAVLCGVCVSRMIPGLPDWGRRCMPGAVYLLVMGLQGNVDLTPLPGLLLGGVLSVFLPAKPDTVRRRGKTAAAQLRLEAMSRVLSQTRVLMMETEGPGIDEEALLARTRERACGSCPNRKACQSPNPIPREVLRRPMLEGSSLPFSCRKSGRMLLEIRRTQEQYRLLKADRDRRREYREAVSQQYFFLSEYLLNLAELLPGGNKRNTPRFSPEVAACARGKEPENGDKFRHFPGTEGDYYLLLCDGMGTGLGAAQEAREASRLLHRMLAAGFPAEHALGSLNSLLVLRGRAGAVTVDLARIRLDTGAVALYKWGAAPSYWLCRGNAEKIGTAGPPPGIGVNTTRETVERLSLRRGEALIMVSDGMDGEEVQRRAMIDPEAAAGEMAACLLEAGAAEAADDATVAVVRLRPLNLST